LFAAREAQLFLEGLKTPEKVAEETLLEKIVRPNAASEIGRLHGFGGIASIEDYRRRVPIRGYEDFRPFIERMVEGEEGVLFTEPIRRFFLTSGSTAKPKYVPVTSSFVRDKSRAFGIYWSLVFDQHPDVSNDKIVTNFSDSGEMGKAPSGLPASSESAYWSQVTAATQRRAKPIIPKIVARIADTEARYYAIARILLEEEFHALMTLNPSTIYLLFHKMNVFKDQIFEDIEMGTISAGLPFGDDVRAYVKETYRPNPERRSALEASLSRDEPRLRASSAWPNLKLVVSWRSPMLAPYLRLLDPHLANVASRDYISMASEGIISIPVRDGKSGGVVANSVHFYEFIPEEDAAMPSPETKLPHELEVGRRYVVVLSTTGGLYRYNIGDVVRVVDYFEKTAVIEFLHRTGNTCSLTGEKLTEDQVTEAVADVAKGLALEIESFTAHPAESGFPRYVFLVELKGPADRAQLARFPGEIDRALEARNIEYGSKRESERLGAPELWIVTPGGYAARRGRRVAEGANDAQLKPTHLSRDSEFWRQFEIAERFHEE
jgi:GH3 auxin-responsive promoter